MLSPRSALLTCEHAYLRTCLPVNSTPKQNSGFAHHIELGMARANVTHNSQSACLLDACFVKTPVLYLSPELFYRLFA